MDWSKRQKEIIEAAISLIAQNGIEGLTTKALAAAVGISEPALYRHFSNKAKIVQAVIGCFDDDVENLKNTQRGWQFIKAFFKPFYCIGSLFIAEIIFIAVQGIDNIVKPEHTNYRIRIMIKTINIESFQGFKNSTSGDTAIIKFYFVICFSEKLKKLVYPSSVGCYTITEETYG